VPGFPAKGLVTRYEAGLNLQCGVKETAGFFGACGAGPLSFCAVLPALGGCGGFEN
jgi:hypothetical protein